MLKETTFHRLTKIRDHLLQKVKDENFYLGSWAGSFQNPYYNDKDIISCQTVACAIGHACTIPAFKEMGLHLKKNDGRSTAVPTFEGLIGIKAVAAFLDLSPSATYRIKNNVEERVVCGETACSYLFLDYYYGNGTLTSKQEVIDRINYFIELNRE